MKIVLYKPTVHLSSGGVTRAVLDLSRTLAARRHEVTLISCDPADEPPDVPPEWDGSKGTPRVERISRSTNPLRPFNRVAQNELVRLINGVDVVHLHIIWDPTCLVVARIARQLGIPYVITSHGMLDDWCMAQGTMKKKLYLAAFGNSLFRHAAAIHCTAQAELEQSRKWFPHTRGEVIPYLFDLAPYRELPGVGPALARFPELLTDLPRILFLSRLHFKKGVELLLQATDRLRQDGVLLKVFIAGSGEPSYEASLKEMTGQLGLEECVHFLGFVSGMEKLSLYQAADVFVLPTSQENFGFVLVESLACGTPVITTNGVDIWRELEERCEATIVKPQPESVAAGIRKLCEGIDANPDPTDVGRQGVLTWLHQDKLAEAYDELYSSIISSE